MAPHHLELFSYRSNFHVGAVVLFHAVEIRARARLIRVYRLVCSNENDFILAGVSAFGIIFFCCFKHTMLPFRITQIQYITEKGNSGIFILRFINVQKNSVSVNV